nr:F0F1 ATP synthase subunit epsilon [Frigoriglobus tundricola]
MAQPGARPNREPPPINLKILLPFMVFAQKAGVKRIVALTPRGSFGLLPNRLDCTAALAPGILAYETGADGEVFVAVDAGVLVKAGADVLVSVRNAIAGTDLDTLHAAVKREFLALNDQEKTVRTVLAKMEGGFVRKFVELQRG